MKDILETFFKKVRFFQIKIKLSLRLLSVASFLHRRFTWYITSLPLQKMALCFFPLVTICRVFTLQRASSKVHTHL
jgi:hypothetical protein